VNRWKAFVVLILLASVSCRRDADVPSATGTASPPAQRQTAAAPRPGQTQKAERVVEEFGRRMKNVPTSASLEIASKAVREEYGGLVDKLLLAVWEATPSRAPGRQVSSPWPERIEIASSTNSGAEVVVIGMIVETASAGVVRRVPVEIRLRPEGDSWVIAAFIPLQEEPAAPASG
jgi:hypothetical protein